MILFYVIFLILNLQVRHISSSKNETKPSENIVEVIADTAQKDELAGHPKIVEETEGNNTKSDENVKIITGISDDINSTKNESTNNNRRKRQLIGVHIFERPNEGVKARGGGGRHGGGYGHKPIKKGGGHGPVVHHGGGYGHEIHHDGGYSDPHGGYAHVDHGGGYGHDDHHDGGYGHDSHGHGHEGYKEPPKKIKPAPYYGPQYSPYDLVAPDKSKKGKVKYGDDPVSESKKGSYHRNSYDKPLKHFGGFGGGGSIGYNAGSLKGHKGGGYGGYGGGHGGGHGKGHGGGHGKGHGGGYGKGPKKGHGKGHGGGYGKGHGGGFGKGHGGGYGKGHEGGYLYKSEPLIGGYSAEEAYQHQGGGGGIYTDNNYNTYEGLKGLKVYEGDVKNIKHIDYLPVPVYTPLSSPYNTYDAHANFRTSITKGSNVGVTHMLLADPYTSSINSKARIDNSSRKRNSKT